MNDPGQNVIAFLFKFGVHPGGPRHGLRLDQNHLYRHRRRFGNVWRGGIVMKEGAANRDIPRETDCCEKSRVARSLLWADDKPSQLAQLERNRRV